MLEDVIAFSIPEVALAIFTIVGGTIVLLIVEPFLAYILANTDGPFANIFQEFAKGRKSAAKPK